MKRQATTEDLKKGTTLIMPEGYRFTLISKLEDEEGLSSVWEARGDRGEKLIFEYDVQYYMVEE